MKTSTNSPAGGHHWYHTLLGRILRVGEYIKDVNEDNINPGTLALLPGYGKLIFNDAKELIEGWGAITNPHPVRTMKVYNLEAPEGYVFDWNGRQIMGVDEMVSYLLESNAEYVDLKMPNDGYSTVPWVLVYRGILSPLPPPFSESPEVELAQTDIEVEGNTMRITSPGTSDTLDSIPSAKDFTNDADLPF